MGIRNFNDHTTKHTSRGRFTHDGGGAAAHEQNSLIRSFVALAPYSQSINQSFFHLNHAKSRKGLRQGHCESHQGKRPAEVEILLSNVSKAVSRSKWL
jgi:hypothetical protein